MSVDPDNPLTLTTIKINVIACKTYVSGFLPKSWLKRIIPDSSGPLIAWSGGYRLGTRGFGYGHSVSYNMFADV